jgi:hypothetical protein
MPHSALSAAPGHRRFALAITTTDWLIHDQRRPLQTLSFSAQEGLHLEVANVAGPTTLNLGGSSRKTWTRRAHVPDPGRPYRHG